MAMWSTFLMPFYSAHCYQEFPSDTPPGLVYLDERPVGWQWHFRDQDGNPGMMEKISDTVTLAGYQRSDGCRWVRPKSGFAPAIEWNNCPSSGQAEITLQGDSIWPLMAGKTFEYIGKASSSLSEKRKNIRRRCKVDSYTGLTTIAGMFNTWRVVCKDKWTTRRWWLSPQVGTAVLYTQKTILGDLQIQEMTHIIAPPMTTHQ